MSVGSLGSIVFEVSADRVLTWNTASRTGRARWAKHERLGRKPLTEFTGADLEQFELAIRLDAVLGVNPSTQLDALRDIRDEGEPKILTLGGAVQGYFALENLSETWRNTDGRGRLVLVDVSLSLTEYIQDAEGDSLRGFGMRGLDDMVLRSLYSSGGVAVGDFTLSGLTSDSSGISSLAKSVLSDARVSDILRRVPGLSSLGGMTPAARAVIGSIMSGLPVPSDFSAKGLSRVIGSMGVGSVGATAEQLKTYARMGLSADTVSDMLGTDAPAALKDVSQRVETLTTAQQREAVVALSGAESSKFMAKAMKGFARRL